ncbi:MAG: hypothetical protein Q4G00_10440 [Clostridia bacterium]|nr:hypothetical protein [Clostridia bacterium]
MEENEIREFFHSLKGSGEIRSGYSSLKAHSIPQCKYGPERSKRSAEAIQNERLHEYPQGPPLSVGFKLFFISLYESEAHSVSCIRKEK